MMNRNKRCREQRKFEGEKFEQRKGCRI